MTTTDAADPPLLPVPQRTLPQMLRRQAQCFGDAPAVRLGDQRWRHAELPRRAAARAGALQVAGVARGDRVAILAGNRPQFLDAFIGCGWIGAVAVPINTASMGPQIEYFLANSQAALLVIEAQYLDRLATADLGRTALRRIWVLEGEGATVPASVAGVAVEAWPSEGDEAAPAEVGPADTLAILYTSGTTGPSKGVLCPHAQYYWWGVNSLRVLGVRADDVLCTTLPLFHINALNTFAQACLSGAEAVFEGRFSASGFWPSMQACGATVVYLLGAMVPILLAQPEGAAEREHRVRIGLGPGVPGAAGEAFAARTGVRLLEGYGSTETNFVIATAPDSPRGGVMGWVLPGFEARVADEHDAELPDGQAGELLLRAHEPHAFASGYFQMPDKTVEAWRNLWFHTGDRVVREADGALRFVDRIKDAIRRRGENISSFEVEQVLQSHPAVATVAVYPVRSELAEDEVMAALILREGQAPAPQELAAWCEARLPYFAVPRWFDIVDDLPRTENGKVQKYKLRERGVTPTAWERPPQPRARRA
ncbi:ATP-dependent acyl-CoA ligase [Pseudacidovorax intermedius]|uniref:Crotonobetainyl-CoA:carnitine CoA-transferase n=1 Tax=Pseudacidovorax intermedius TaxID=433924 RepID=A0A147H2G6_9BURK|nr:ATP-dependent acyl-CoA ligase [Pseudacidovorax intermedius]KTT24118.1 crotonobetainyl-CoA:carnitine CoA-transferase [Pseudacidovorax intermedius]